MKLSANATTSIIRATSEFRVVGKALFLVSGGIDSPVAAWLLMRKGVEAVFAYFDNYPLCDQAAESIALDTIRKVCQQAGVEGGRVYVVAHSPDLQDILSKCPVKYACIISRRIMFRVAERIALREGCEAIVTGDALGQKASQTLQNIVAADSVIKEAQVLRPLVGMNKLQIEQCAKKIGTYTISIRPGVASCGVPTDNPSTSARRDQLKEAELALDVESMVKRDLEKARILTVGNGD
jgi:thiamine biosynthesis protein ThiI